MPPARRTANRNAEKATPRTGRNAKKPRIPASGAGHRPRGKEPENPENATENTPPDVKLHENRNAEKAVTTNGRAAKRPQIPAFREKNGPPNTQPENPEGGDQNAPPDGKLPENRNAENAIPKTGRNAKRPQIPTSGAKNQPRRTQPENPENDTENAPPDQKSQTPEGRKRGGPNSNPALPLLNAHPWKSAYINV